MPFQKIQLNNPKTDKLIQWTYFVVAPLLLGIVMAALFFTITTNTSLKGVASRVQKLSEDNKSLSEQNKKLSEQNKDLNKQTQSVVQQNREYIRCLATTFAQYTRDQQPIGALVLDTCDTTNGRQPYPDTSQSASDRAASGNGESSTSSSTSSSNSTPINEQSQPNNLQNNDNTGTKSPQPVEVLGVPLCVPFTKMCVLQ